MHFPLLRFVGLSAVGAAFGMCIYQLGYQAAADDHYKTCAFLWNEDEYKRKLGKAEET